MAPTENPTEQLRRDIAAQIRLMRSELPRLESAYTALGGNLDALVGRRGATQGSPTASMHVEVTPTIPSLVRENIMEMGKRRTGTLIEWLKEAHGVDIGREELEQVLATSSLFRHGKQGWWALREGDSS